MLHRVVNLDTGEAYWFHARTPYEAMTHLRYWLACSDGSAEKCIINKTESGLHLYLEHKGERWSVRM